jgi:isoleucyl-tRNA synthetase
LYRLNLALVRLLAPLLAYTCEEVWKHMQAGTGGVESVHIAYFPQANELTTGLSEKQRRQAGDWEQLRGVRDQVLKVLDKAREEKAIGSSLEAAVVLSPGKEVAALLESNAAELPAWFIVSQVELEPSAGEETAVRVERARGDKCERCWKFTLDVGSDESYPTVCAACAGVLREIIP